MRNSEEHHEWNAFYSWLFIIGLAAFLLGGMMFLMMIPEVPRHWDFGTIPFTPAQSVFSTSTPKKVSTREMIEPLPEGIPMHDTRP